MGRSFPFCSLIGNKYEQHRSQDEYETNPKTRSLLNAGVGDRISNADFSKVLYQLCHQQLALLSS